MPIYIMLAKLTDEGQEVIKKKPYIELGSGGTLIPLTLPSYKYR